MFCSQKSLDNDFYANKLIARAKQCKKYSDPQSHVFDNCFKFNAMSSVFYRESLLVLQKINTQDSHPRASWFSNSPLCLPCLHHLQEMRCGVIHFLHQISTPQSSQHVPLTAAGVGRKLLPPAETALRCVGRDDAPVCSLTGLRSLLLVNLFHCLVLRSF